MNLSEHFSLEEMTRSDYAIRKGIDNTPTQAEIENLKKVVALLEIIRDKIGAAIYVNSGFRNKTVNTGIGGSKTSQHCFGEAADIEADGFTVQQLYDTIKGMVLNKEIEVGELIQEFNSWVHISIPNEKNKNEFLIATKEKVNGKMKTIYTKD